MPPKAISVAAMMTNRTERNTLNYILNGNLSISILGLKKFSVQFTVRTNFRKMMNVIVWYVLLSDKNVVPLKFMIILCCDLSSTDRKN